jgi:aminoglycoside 2''-phosphotransferase
MIELEERLARAFPELRVAPLRQLETGFHSLAVETSDGVVFRIPRHPGTANGHATEFRVLPVLAAHLPTSVPLPEWRIEPGHPDFPLGTIGYRKLAGHSPRAGTPRLGSDLAAFLAALHAFPLDEAEELGLAAWCTPRDGLVRFRDLVVPALRKLLRPDEHSRVVAWWDALLAGSELERFEPALRHGDPWFGNLLVNDAGALCGVLDWEGVEIGDAAADFAAVTYLGEPFLAAVLARYGPVDAAFKRRIELLGQLREFGGIRISLEIDDQEELEDAVRKLRASPILRATISPSSR